MLLTHSWAAALTSDAGLSRLCYAGAYRMDDKFLVMLHAVCPKCLTYVNPNFFAQDIYAAPTVALVLARAL